LKRGMRSGERGICAALISVPHSAVRIPRLRAAVTPRAHPGCSRLRSLARSRDGCRSQAKLAPLTFVACRKCLLLRSPPLGAFDTEAHSVR
jgi:hypothetical protein